MDARTLMVVVAALFSISALFLFMLWRTHRQLAGLAEWAMGLGGVAIGGVLLISRGVIPDILSIFTGNILLCGGFGVVAVGNYKYSGVHYHCGVVVVVLVALTVTLIPTYNFPEYFQIRVIAFSISMAILSGWASWPLVRAQRYGSKESALAHRVVAAAFIVNGAVCLARVAVEMAWLPAEDRSMWAGDVTALYYFWTTLLAFSMASGFPVMVADRLRNQLQEKVRELEVAHKTAEDALREHRNFLTMISHEFRNPLSIVNAAAEVIACNLPPDDTESAGEISRIRRAIRRLSNMVEGCLTDEWLMAEAQAIRVTSFDIRKVLGELAAEYSVKLNWRGGASLCVEGDRYLLPVALSGVIENACKYGKSREGVVVDVGCLVEKASDGRAPAVFVIDIHDDGPGIPEEERSRVFEKYYRAAQGLYRPGSGLGLFLARRILDMHGGSIDIVDPSAARYPSRTVGCTVRLRLPCGRAGEATE